MFQTKIFTNCPILSSSVLSQLVIRYLALFESCLSDYIYSFNIFNLRPEKKENFLIFSKINLDLNRSNYSFFI